MSEEMVSGIEKSGYGVCQPVLAGLREAGAKAQPEDPSTLWKELVAGKWRITDRVEEAGRCHWILQPAPGEQDEARALNPRELAVAELVALGRSNKCIAFDLKMGVSTVAGHIASIERKLGLSSRLELIQLFACFPGEVPSWRDMARD